MRQHVGRYRWTVCALVFFATTVNYLDRQTISLVKVNLDAEFHWTKTDYANITVAFQLFYALGLLVAGWVVDRLGTKMGFAISLFLWSLVAIGHAFIRSTGGFLIARGALGITESGNFPSAIKTVAEWFPKQERALATGIFNSGTNIGAIIAPLSVPFIALQWGWRWAFVATGAVGLIWLIFWFWLYDVPANQKRLRQNEFDYINSDREQITPDSFTQTRSEGLSWGRLLEIKETWAIAIGKFLTDGVWWFYLFWLPDFLHEQYKLSETGVAIPVAVVYIISSAGSIFGGWLPMKFMKNGWPVFKARRVAMFIYALFALPVLMAQALGNYSLWFPILIIGLGTAAHQAWSANIFTLASDLFPKKAVASVTGIGGMAGAVGGILVQKAAGYLFDHYKAEHQLSTGYLLVFSYCGVAYLTAWAVIQLLVPKMERTEI